MKRNATAIWKGSGKDGTGTVSVQSGLFSNAQYSYKSRFEEGPGTNPEELVAAAHAGCFDMKLSFVLQEAGFTADSLETTAEVTLENGTVTKSHLTLKAKIPGISQEQFDKAADDAKANCPISKLLKAEITLDKTLEG